MTCWNDGSVSKTLRVVSLPHPLAKLYTCVCKLLGIHKFRPGVQVVVFNRCWCMFQFRQSDLHDQVATLWCFFAVGRGRRLMDYAFATSLLFFCCEGGGVDGSGGLDSTRCGVMQSAVGIVLLFLQAGQVHSCQWHIGSAGRAKEQNAGSLEKGSSLS